MKRSLLFSFQLAAVSAFAAPQAEIRSFIQSDDRTVTLTYTLAEDAIVTLSLKGQDGSGSWTSLDDSVVQYAAGDVNREVSATTGDAVRTITWRPDLADGPDAATVKPVLTAWSKEDPPDYMVVDLAEVSASRVRYYASSNALPGGLLGNAAYRTSLLVLRKIPAKGVTWKVGSDGENGRNIGVASGVEAEPRYEAKFDSNYYMAVFETTEAQWFAIKGPSGLGSTFDVGSDSLMLPVNAVSYCDIREAANNSPNTAYEYPNEPHPDSFLGVLRSRTGLDGFDLPSEAEWEYACRAGNGDNLWGNGAAYVYSTWEPDARVPGRYKFNQPTTTATTAPVGSYAPNAWGIYDMHGNVFEWCLDWYKNDVSSLAGAINTAGGTFGVYKSVTAKQRNRRGGAFDLPIAWLRSACRTPESGNSRGTQNGFRVKFGAAKTVSAE